MRNLITSLALIITLLGYSQSKSMNGTVVKETVNVESIAVTVTVDSAEEIKSTFKLEDIKEIIEESGDNETLSFKIICNGDKMSNGVKSNMSYKVEGNTNDAESFLKSVEKIRTSAINYYKNNN